MGLYLMTGMGKFSRLDQGAVCASWGPGRCLESRARYDVMPGEMREFNFDEVERSRRRKGFNKLGFFLAGDQAHHLNLLCVMFLICVAGQLSPLYSPQLPPTKI